LIVNVENRKIIFINNMKITDLQLLNIMKLPVKLYFFSSELM
jgi:hypothetical protein